MDVVRDIDLLVSRLRAVDWLALQLLLVAGFHLLLASALAAAPARQVVTPGTLPVLDLAPGLSVPGHRASWAVVFVLCAALLLRIWARPTVRAQLLGWFVVIPVGFVWTGTFALAVIDGAGSAIGLSIWVILLCWWGTVAVGIGVREPVPRAR